MIRTTVFAPIALLAASAVAAPLSAASDLSVLPLGHYKCFTPGDAAGPTMTSQTANDFTIIHGSSYETEKGHGTYLLASDLLTFTRGPLKDIRLRKAANGLWRQIARDGEPEALKCSKGGVS